MTFSEDCVALVKRFEGFERRPYRCPAGHRTIGYGHRILSHEMFPPEGITEAQALDLLRADLDACAQCVRACVRVPLAQQQFDALCSFVYNVGCARFRTSTLLRLLNQGDAALAAAEFERWIHAAGQKLAGLARRRAAERAMFERGMSAARNEGATA